MKPGKWYRIFYGVSQWGTERKIPIPPLEQREGSRGEGAGGAESHLRKTLRSKEENASRGPEPSLPLERIKPDNYCIQYGDLATQERTKSTQHPAEVWAWNPRLVWVFRSLFGPRASRSGSGKRNGRTGFGLEPFLFSEF